MQSEKFIRHQVKLTLKSWPAVIPPIPFRHFYQASLAMEMTSVEILNWVTRYGYLGIFALLMLGIVGVPVPDELLLTCAGFLVFKGYLGPEFTVACFHG